MLELCSYPKNTLHMPIPDPELWTAIKAAWDEDLTPAKLECAYRLLTPVMSLVHAKNGGNNFTLPHTGIRKEMREDGWEI